MRPPGAFVEARRCRTSLVIAHRLSTILEADVVFAVDGGRIVDHGTQAGLRARGLGKDRAQGLQYGMVAS